MSDTAVQVRLHDADIEFQMPKVPKKIMKVIVGGKLSNPQIYEKDTIEVFVAVWNTKPQRTDLNFPDASFVSLPMTSSPIKAFSVMTIQEARLSILKDHPARKMYKLPRKTNVFTFTTDRDVDYFVIAKQMVFSVWHDDPKAQAMATLPPVYFPDLN